MKIFKIRQTDLHKPGKYNFLVFLRIFPFLTYLNLFIGKLLAVLGFLLCRPTSSQ